MSLKVRFRETLIQLYGSAGLKNHSTNSAVRPDSSELFLSLRMRRGKPLDVYWLLAFPVTENSVLSMEERLHTQHRVCRGNRRCCRIGLLPACGE